MATTTRPPTAPLAPLQDPRAPDPRATLVLIERQTLPPPAREGSTFERPLRLREDGPNASNVIGILGGCGAACWYVGHYVVPGPLVVAGAALILVALGLWAYGARRRYGASGEAAASLHALPVTVAASTLSERVRRARTPRA